MSRDKQVDSGDGVDLDGMRGTGDYVDGLKHGHWVYFFDVFEDNRKAHEGEYIRGKRHGLWKSWYAYGPKSGECYFKDGEMNGWSVAWHPNGAKASEGEMLDGRQHGVWVSWSDTGELAAVSVHNRGKPDGEWIYWHEGPEGRQGDVRIILEYRADQMVRAALCRDREIVELSPDEVGEEWWERF